MNSQEAAVKIREDGYCLLENVISEERCDHFKELLNSAHRRYAQYYANANSTTSHGLESKDEEKVVYNMHNKHRDFFELLAHEQILSILDIVLKDGSYQNSEPYNLLNISARSPQKGSKGQQLHLDSNLPGGDFPIICVALWMLDHFTAESGATRIVPGSHRKTSYAENGTKYDNEVTICAPRGSVLLFNGSLWHGGGPKSTEDDRWAVVLGYGRWFIKPSFDFVRNTPLEYYNQMTDAEKDLLGFRSIPPIDEFSRIRRRSEHFTKPEPYTLPLGHKSQNKTHQN